MTGGSGSYLCEHRRGRDNGSFVSANLQLQLLLLHDHPDSMQALIHE